MGKFAGFLKRAKKLAGFAGGILSGLNNIYKGVKPFTDDIISAVPFGSYINKGLDIGSKIIDKVQPLTQNWVEDDDKAKLEEISNNIKRYGGDIAQKTLNNYLDTQEELFRRKGNYTFNDYSASTATNALTGLAKNKSLIFGQPLNKV